MTRMTPYQINLGIKQIMDNISKHGNDYSYEQLTYYKMKLLSEIERMNKFVFFKTTPIAIQEEIQNKLIPELQSFVDRIDTLLNKFGGANFSQLTEKLNQINRCI